MDAQPTRERILTAAMAEFAAHGMAGARIDRIAASAQANKERIYAYFGDKEQLFDAVMREAIVRSEAWPASGVDDLVTTTGDLFELSLSSSDVVRLLAWRRLEPSEAAPDEEDIAVYRAKLDMVRQAQEAGSVDAGLDPTDVLALIGALATAWSAPDAPLKAIAESDGPPLRDRRPVIEEAIRRILRPERPERH